MTEPNQQTPIPSIGAAATAYQRAMSEMTSSTVPSHEVASTLPASEASVDVTMNENPAEAVASPSNPPPPTSVLSPVPQPQRNNTPRPTNSSSENVTSRAASQLPESFPAVSTMPAEAPLHGAPTRQYLNTKVTGPLLEGMKQLAKEQPSQPLRALGEFLLQKSKELEGS